MKLRALACAALCLLPPFSPSAAEPAPSRESALLALCRVWNAVRFSHPALQSESDASWDDALLAAAPIVERDPGRLQAAVATMLDALHDPLTVVSAGASHASTAMPAAEDRADIRVVHVNGYPGEATVDAYGKALAAALQMPASDRALVVDLRVADAPSLEQIEYAQDAWTQVRLVPRLANAPVAVPVLANRYFIGFPYEAGTSGQQYREGRETIGPPRAVAPASDARAVPAAFVVDAHAIVPNDAIALEQAGRAAIFASDQTRGILPGTAAELEAGAGLTVTLRSTGLIVPPRVRSGGLEDALAWVRDPKPIAIPVAEPLPTLTADKRFADPALPDAAHRALAAFRVWGAIEYLYPYRDLMRDDWDAALANALAELRGVKTPLEYDLALLKMYAHLHDTHGFVSAPALREAYAGTPPFVARYVEGRPAIVRVDPTAANRDGFRVGDVIEEVDGEPIAARAARLRPYVVASTDQSAREILAGRTGIPSLLAGPIGSRVELRLRGADGARRDVRTPRAAFSAPLHERTRPAVGVLPGNIGYVDLQRLERADVDATFRRLSATRALVFDLRGYPRGTFDLLGAHLAARTVNAALFRTPVSREVGTASDEPNAVLHFRRETRDFYQVIRPAPPHYAQPVVVVIDSRAISQSEHTGLFLAASAHARFVGEPTTGANGDVTGMFVPGGVRLSFTGQAVLHPDGSPLQRVGLVPDVRVSPTLRGIRAGDDELLYAGVREALRLARVDAATMRSALAAERTSERADAQK